MNLDTEKSTETLQKRYNIPIRELKDIYEIAEIQRESSKEVTPKIAEDADLLDMAIHYVELLGVRNYSVFGIKKEVATRNKILKFRDWLKTLESNK